MIGEEVAESYAYSQVPKVVMLVVMINGGTPDLGPRPISAQISEAVFRHKKSVQTFKEDDLCT